MKILLITEPRTGSNMVHRSIMLYNCETPYSDTIPTREPFNKWKKSIYEFGEKSNNLEQNKRDFWDYLSNKKSWTVKTHTEQFKDAIRDHALLYKIADCVVYLQRKDKVAQIISRAVSQQIKNWWNVDIQNLKIEHKHIVDCVNKQMHDDIVRECIPRDIDLYYEDSLDPKLVWQNVSGIAQTVLPKRQLPDDDLMPKRSKVTIDNLDYVVSTIKTLYKAEQ